jgi:endo-1,4-beta-xylanase
MHRRSFLASTAAGLGLAALDSSFPPSLFAKGEPVLKDAGKNCAMLIGFSTVKSGIVYGPAMVAFVKANCNLMTPAGELKWAAIRPTQDVFRFDGADFMYDFAHQNGMAFRGHNLCWNSSNPPWLAQTLNKSNAEAILVDHITKVAGRFAGKIDSWDVVNEPVAVWYNKPGGLYPGPWLDALGPEYIDIAFHAAAAADPQSVRVLNVHHVEHTHDELTRVACLNLLESLLKRKVPVQALGIESHIDAVAPFDQGLLQGFIRKVRGMGLEVQITELDVNDSKVEGDIPHRDQAVADCYRRYLDIVLPVANIRRLVFWSITDQGNWMNYMKGAQQWQRADGAPHRPGIIDDTMQPKPALSAVMASLQSNCTKPGQ